MTPIAIYLRISHDPLKLAAGVTRQRKDCLALIASRFPGHPHRVYEDNDRSAWSGKRPEWDRMLSDLASGAVSMVVAYNLDRLTRRPIELEHLIALGAVVVTAAGDLDLTTHDGQLSARILIAVARKSSDDTSRRTKRGALDRAEKGRWIGGRPPYPYVSHGGALTFRSGDAATVSRLAVDLFLDGHSLRSITRTCAPMDSTAPQTPQGWRWVLLSPCLAALNTAGIPGQWTPIVTPVEHATIRHRLTDPARRLHAVHNPRERANFLTGLLRCGVCDRTMNASRDYRTKYLTYRCSSCGRTIHRGRCDAVVATALFARAPLSPVHPLQVREAPPLDGLREERLQDLARDYALGAITRGEWEAARNAIQGVHQLSVPQVRDRPELPEDLSLAWASMDVTQRHAIALLYLSAVTVAPALHGRHDITTRLSFQWIA